jgi:hypothetical protein
LGRTLWWNKNANNTSPIHTNLAFLLHSLTIVTSPLSSLWACIRITSAEKSIPICTIRTSSILVNCCRITFLSIPICSWLTLSLLASWILIIPYHSIGTISIGYTLTINLISIQRTKTWFSYLIITFWTNSIYTICSIPLLICWTKTSTCIRIKDSLLVTNNAIISTPIAVSTRATTLCSYRISSNWSTWNAACVV